MNMWREQSPVPQLKLFCLVGGPTHPEKWGNDVKWVDSIGPLHLLWCEKHWEANHFVPWIVRGSWSLAIRGLLLPSLQKCRSPVREHNSRHLELSSWQPGATVISCGLASFNAIAKPGKLGTDVTFMPSLLTLEGLFSCPPGGVWSFLLMPDSSDTYTGWRGVCSSYILYMYTFFISNLQAISLRDFTINKAPV